MLTKNKPLWAIDTNILVYATAPDAPPDKQRKAIELLKQLFTSLLACVSGQVLSEYVAVVLRKKNHALHDGHGDSGHLGAVRASVGCL